MPTMSGSNANNNPANGSTVILPKFDAGVLGGLKKSVTDVAHFVMRFYFSILLYIYFSWVKVFTMVLQPFQPILEQMNKVPPKDASVEGIKNQGIRLLSTILVYLSPLVTRAVGIATKPLVWARDQIIKYVEEGEKSGKQTDPKALRNS